MNEHGGAAMQPQGRNDHSSSGAVRGAKIFISYRRLTRSASQAETLFGWAIGRGFEPLLDREGIAAGEDWKQRLAELIRSADVIVFILTPDWIASEVCQWEAELAASLGKRLIGAVLEPVDATTMPGEIAKRQYVHLDGSRPLDGELEQLEKFITGELEWMRTQTSLVEAASAWQASNCDPHLILRGQPLVRAEAWLSTPAPAGTAHGEAVSAYILGSRARFDAENEENRLALQRAQVATSRHLASFAERLHEQGRPVDAELVALEALPDDASPERLVRERPFVAEAERALYAARSDGRRRVAVKLEDAVPIDVAVDSSDRKVWLATRGGYGAILDIAGKSTIAERHDVAASAVSADGKRLAVASWTGSLVLMDLESARVLHEERHGSEHRIAAIVISDDGSVVVAVGQGFFAVWWPDGSEGGLAIHPHDCRLSRLEPEHFDAWQTRPLLMNCEGTRIAIVALGMEGGLTVFDTTSGRRLYNFSFEGVSGSAAFSPSHDLLAAVVNDQLCVWSLATGERVAQLGWEEGHRCSQVAFVSGGAELLGLDKNSGLRVWSLADRGSTAKADANGIYYEHFALDRTQRWLCALTTAARAGRGDGQRGMVDIFDLHGQQRTYSLEGHGAAINIARFSPSGRSMATSSYDGQISIWRLGDRGEARIVARLGADTRHAAFTASAKHAVVAGEFGDPELWTLEEPARIAQLVSKRLHFHGTRHIQLTATEDRVVVVSRSAIVHGWELPSGVAIDSIDPTGGISGVTAVSPDGRLIASVGARGYTIALAPIGEQGGQQGYVLELRDATALAFAACGKLLVAGSASGEVRVWRLADGSCVWSTLIDGAITQLLVGESAAIIAILTEPTSFGTPDGLHLVARIGGDGDIRIATLVHGRAKRLLQFLGGAIVYLDEERLRIWDGVSEEPRRSPVEGITCAVFLADGLRAVAGTKSGAIHTIDTASGEVVAAMPGERSPVSALKVLTDERSVLGLLANGALVKWPLFATTQRLVEHAKRRVPRALDQASRKAAFLEPEPPRWYITGAGREGETDRAAWRGKPPYDTEVWRDWLVQRLRVGEGGPLPPLPDPDSPGRGEGRLPKLERLRLPPPIAVQAVPAAGVARGGQATKAVDETNGIAGAAKDSAESIWHEFKGQTRFTPRNYYDPDGYELRRDFVRCGECLFELGDSCLLWREKGCDKGTIDKNKIATERERYCDFFLSDFDDDEEAKRRIRDLNKRLRVG